MIYKMSVIKILLCISLTISLPSIAASRGQLKFLNEETWGEMLDGEWMVEFFAPWCPACRQLEPVWQEFSSWGDDLGIQVGAIDVTINPGLSGRFAITALPTIFHVKDGVFRQYRGSKRREELISFIEEAKWKDIEPIPSWKSPDSFQMSSLAHFFKLSMFLRTMHNEIVEFGIPYWGSYVIFGLATILLGTVLGLIIVCIIDYLCPTKRPAQQHSETYEQPKKEPVEEEAEAKDTDEENSETEDKNYDSETKNSDIEEKSDEFEVSGDHLSSESSADEGVRQRKKETTVADMASGDH